MPLSLSQITYATCNLCNTCLRCHKGANIAGNRGGADETSLNINGKLHWMWAWQSERLTYLVASTNRAFKTIEDTFVNGLPKAAANHDRYAAHFKMNARQHQMCTAHLLRDLTYLDELYNTKCGWAKDFKQLLSDAVALKKQLTVNQYYHPDQQRYTLFRQMDYLLRYPVDGSHAKAKTLQKKLLSQQNAILYFLLEPDVPPENNGSERAIRNVKVKQKILGQYKSMDGAEMFAILRPVIDTRYNVWPSRSSGTICNRIEGN